jgi:DNA-binding NtrC family response regulator
MQKPIVITNADEEQCQELCAILEREHFSTTALHSRVSLEKENQRVEPQMAILDLDTLSVDNRLFKDLKRKNPALCIICLSSRPFHPELEEAMSKYIHACLSKPVDEEELVIWVRSSCEA